MGHYDELYDLDAKAEFKSEKRYREQVAQDIARLLPTVKKYPAAYQKIREAYLEVLHGYEI